MAIVAANPGPRKGVLHLSLRTELPVSSPDVAESRAIELDPFFPSREGGSDRRLGLKRAVDVLLATLLLLLTAPFMVLIALLIRLTSRGKALFVQPRVGFKCREFRMYKFRSMVDGAHRVERALANANGDQIFLKLAEDPRVTWLGKLLRKSSMDELPQLLNVLRGEMSLVGPRPLLLSDFEKFPRSAQMKRFGMKPGLTGLWQVSGRSRLPDVDRIRLDSEYVDTWSPWLDFKILLRTIPAVLRGDGAT